MIGKQVAVREYANERTNGGLYLRTYKKIVPGSLLYLDNGDLYLCVESTMTPHHFTKVFCIPACDDTPLPETNVKSLRLVC